MFSTDFFLRVLLAVFGAIILLMIIPAFLRLIGFPTSSDLILIIRAIVAAVAIFYVFGGTTFFRR